MPDDPIFDPWSAGEPDDAVADLRAPDSPPERGPTAAVRPTAADAASEPARRWVTPALPVPRSRLPAESRSPGETPPRAEVQREPSRRPAPLVVRDASGHVETPSAWTLRTVVLPRLEALRGRLELSGHEVTLDDRTHRESPAVRFRLRPRLGPFDDGDDVASAVLEVLWDTASGQIAARIWSDAMDEVWSHEVMAPIERVDHRWADRVIVEFVARVMGTAR